MVTFNPGLITQSMVQPDKVGLNFRDFSWIGILTPDFRVCSGFGPDGVKNWDELMQRKQFVLGTTAKGDGAYINGAMLRDIFGAPVKEILGFPGSAEQRIAIERGELDGDCGTFSSIPAEWLRDNKAHPFVRFTKERLPEMPESALFINDLAKTREQTDLLNFLDAENEIGRVVIMSRQVEADRIAIIRRAFNETMKDSDFVDDMKTQRLPVNPMSGDEAEQIIVGITNASPQIIEEARKIFD
jgi:tripartite-type tricarboxylate transporter receptor subunit TctC